MNDCTMDKATTKCDSEGNYTLLTRRDHETFLGKDAESIATLQAKALADFNSGSGRYLVYNVSETESKVIYDECSERDGIEEDHVYEACQHSNSGTYEWNEVRLFNVMDV